MIELDRYWENPRWLARGRVPAGAYSIPFPAGDVRKLDVLGEQDCYRSLCGDGDSGHIPLGSPSWRLHLPGGSTSAWLWLWFLWHTVYWLTLQCLLHRSPYTDTPVAAYVRDFELPKSWAEDREIHFVLEGVRSCCFLWVNGSLVGYSQGSGLPSEFVITPWLGSGKNRIAVAVFAWCDGSYLESYGAPWGLVGMSMC
ncbi:MAG: sugar-binding domain-containing protein [Bianqueaceae bacterium]